MEKTGKKKTETKRGFMQDFNNIRELLRLIYIYGCYTGKDFSERGIFTIVNPKAEDIDPSKKHIISTRKRIDEMNRIRYFLPEKFLVMKKTEEGTVPSIHYNIYAGNDDVLLSTYKTKAITEGQILTYFLVLQGLNLFIDEKQDEYDDEISYDFLSGLCADLVEMIGDHPVPGSRLREWITVDNTSSSQINQKDEKEKKLREKIYGISDLEDAGILVSKKDAFRGEKVQRVVYALKPTLIEYLNMDSTGNDIGRLFQYMKFLAGSSLIPAPYYLLSERLRRNMEDNNFNVVKPKVFFRHNYLYGSLDDNVKISLLQAIHSHQLCELRYKSEQRIFGQDVNYSAKKSTVVPVRLLHNSLTGQQYLILYDPKGNKAESLRVDLIISAEAKKMLSDAEFQAAEDTCKAFDSAWCSSPFKLDERHHVIIRFHFGKDDPDENRLVEEAEKGKLQRLETGIYQYELDVTDPNEMVPWINSFGHRAKLISTDETTEALSRRMREKWTRLRKKYGTL